jgi:ABC-type Zn uptake system ZnuABC Zn-binding protein ZnuA
MGLDAYLMAERNNTTTSVVKGKYEAVDRPTEAVGHVKTGDAELRPSEVCWPIASVRLEIQYWRKHWDLHELINQSYASPDEYNENPMKVYLSPENLREIAAKIRDDLTEDADPRYRHHTEREEYAKKFDLAADWIEFDGWNRSVYYRGDF